MQGTKLIQGQKNNSPHKKTYNLDLDMRFKLVFVHKMRFKLKKTQN